MTTLNRFTARLGGRWQHFSRAKQKLALGALLAVCGTSLAEHQTLQLANTRLLGPEETLLVNALHNWEDSNPTLALSALDSLLVLAPNFGVAQSLRQTIQQHPSIDASEALNLALDNSGSNANESELKQRYQYFLDPVATAKVPANLWRLSESQQYAVVVDLNRNRMYLFENRGQRAQLISDQYAGIGSKGVGKQLEGDRKTPIGVYFVTQQLADEDLDELYGIGAYPVNYPNALDQQRGRTGSGIWIHGVPRSTWTRAPLSSRGCVTVANRDFERLMGRVEAGSTPVIFADQLDWVEPASLQAEQDQLLKSIQQWADDWQSLNTAKYLTHYSEDFVGQQKDLATWTEHKYRVNERKEWIKLSLTDISLFKDPNEDVVVATFLQDYQSNNFSSEGYKRQYWQRQDDGSWKILFENGL
jgi:murein L,D-transpeptidase YafK